MFAGCCNRSSETGQGGNVVDILHLEVEGVTCFGAAAVGRRYLDTDCANVLIERCSAEGSGDGIKVQPYRKRIAVAERCRVAQAVACIQIREGIAWNLEREEHIFSCRLVGQRGLQCGRIVYKNSACGTCIEREIDYRITCCVAKGGAVQHDSVPQHYTVTVVLSAGNDMAENKGVGTAAGLIDGIDFGGADSEFDHGRKACNINKYRFGEPDSEVKRLASTVEAVAWQMHCCDFRRHSVSQRSSRSYLYSQVGLFRSAFLVTHVIDCCRVESVGVTRLACIGRFGQRGVLKPERICSAIVGDINGISCNGGTNITASPTDKELGGLNSSTCPCFDMAVRRRCIKRV